MNEQDWDSPTHIKMFRKGDHRLFDKTPIADLPKRFKMTPASSDWDRHIGWSFSALEGMLRKGLNQPWDKTYSNIVAYVHKHYCQDIWHEVLRNVAFNVELKPMDLGDGIYAQENGYPFFKSRRDAYYVDPKDGILKIAKPEWSKIEVVHSLSHRRWPDHDKVVYLDNHCYRQMNGIWYEVELVYVPNNPGNKSYSSKPHHWYSHKENDWLWKMNLRDVIFKDRIDSSMLPYLALTHGYRTLKNKLITNKEYQDKLSKALKADSYVNQHNIVSSSWGEKYVYAKSIRQLRKAEIRRFDLDDKRKITLPDIVR